MTPTTASLRGSNRGRRADPTFRWLVTGCGLAVLAVLAWMIASTSIRAWPVFESEGLAFFYGTDWDPGRARDEITGSYQVAEFLWGTLMTSVIALLWAVPLAVGIALYITQLAPRRVRKPLTYAVDTLAAVPSIVYGLWGSLFLIPLLLPLLTWISETFGETIPIFAGPVQVRNPLMAGIVLGIMILPIISAVTREVFATVPADERYAAFGLGATNWEVMRHVVLSRSRPGIIGATMLGLGRALGETIAVLLIIGGSEKISTKLFQAQQSAAAQIASKWKDAAPEAQQGLIALGVALFLMTIVVNVAARLIVSRMGRITGDAAL